MFTRQLRFATFHAWRSSIPGANRHLRVWICVGLASIVFGGCHPRGADTQPQLRAATMRAAAVGLHELDERCVATCQRQLSCQSSSNDGQDCNALCQSQLEHPELSKSWSSTWFAEQGRCLELSNCAAFLSCQHESTALPPSQPQSLAQLREACENQCQALETCTREVLCESEDCELAANETSPDSGMCRRACEDSRRPCAVNLTCSQLEQCSEAQIEHARVAPAPPVSASSHKILGIPARCEALCRRTIRCGAEDAGIASPELEQLEARLLDSSTECELQCARDFEADRQAEFDQCLSQAECDRFIECANKL